MKKLIFPLLFVLSFNLFIYQEVKASKKETKKADIIHENRIKIGPITTAPIEYKGSLYFLAGTGILFKSNHDLSQIKNIFKTNKSTFSGLTLHQDIVFFGEGLHKDKNSFLFAYNLKKNKLEFKLPFTGHIERSPLVHQGIVYLGHGPTGVSAVSLETKKVLWTQNKVEIAPGKSQELHVDATPVPYKRKGKWEICVPSVYQFKGIACLDAKTGSVNHHQPLLLSPKSEMELVGENLVGFATEGTMNDNEFKNPTRFYIFNLKNKKLIKEVNLRGYNFFSPIKAKDKDLFVTLSTGDLITINTDNGKIGYVSEFPEPFISTPFKVKGDLCAIGVMGKLLCFKKTKTGYAISREKRYYESPIGQVKEIKGKLYIPSRMGYFHL